MTPDLQARCVELSARGRVLATKTSAHESRDYWCSSGYATELRTWIGSVANFFYLCATPETYFHREAKRIAEDSHLADGVPRHTVRNLLGLLAAIEEEMKLGLLRKAEYIFVASTFDDFLEHASEFHRSNKKIESSVLCSAVFEDAVRKLAEKFSVTQAGRALDAVIDDLAKQGATTPVKSRRWKSYAAIRNKALHAQWDDFDIRDVAEMLTGTREIVESL